MKKMKRLYRAAVLFGLCLVLWSAIQTQAAQKTLAIGTYEADASLSCYIGAMGGVEFGDGLFQGASVSVTESGEVTATLRLGAGNVTIYSVTCDTFVDAGVSEPGYYDENGAVQTAQYTKSAQTVLNASNESVPYVDSMTFPVTPDKTTYHLWIYVNSNVMGSQFGDGSGTGASGTPGANTPYAAVFTINWDSIPGAAESAQTTDANVEQMDGLSIYRAEETIAADTELSGETVASEYHPIVIYMCLGMGMLFILLGGIFLLSGNRTKEHVIVIRLETGAKKYDDSEK